MDLRHAGLGQFHDLSDLFQGQFFIIIQGDDEALLLGQQADGVYEEGLHLLPLQVAQGVRLTRHAQGVHEGDGLVVVRAVGQLVEGEEGRGGDVVQQVVEVVQGDAEALRDLPLRGGASEPVLQGGDGPLHLAGLGPGGARGPVHGPEFVEDGPPDADGGVALELDPLFGVEAVEGLDQPDHPGADQVVQLDGSGDPHGDPARDVLHHGQVVGQLPLTADGLGRGGSVLGVGLGGDGFTGLFGHAEAGPCVGLFYRAPT